MFAPKSNHAIYNIFIWLSLFSGLGIQLCLFSIEWYTRATHQCPKIFVSLILSRNNSFKYQTINVLTNIFKDSFVDFLIPRSITCYIWKLKFKKVSFFRFFLLFLFFLLFFSPSTLMIIMNATVLLWTLLSDRSVLKKYSLIYSTIVDDIKFSFYFIFSPVFGSILSWIRLYFSFFF